MKFFNLFLIASVMILSINTASAAQRKHVITPKLGYYEMKNGTTAGYRYDTSSDIVFGFEYERRFDNGLTIGAEHMHFENDNISNPNEGELRVNVFFFNSKYYFNYKEGSRFRPFIGLGAGYAFGNTRYEDGGGESVQAMVGIAYEWDRVGMYFQYKRMYSKIDLSYFFYEKEYDISGQGFFTGVIIKF